MAPKHSASKYVFIMRSIAGVGGAEIYYRNKINYCNKQGYETYVFYVMSGKLVINDLKKYEGSLLAELRYTPLAYPLKTAETVVSRMLSGMEYHDGDSVYIESGFVWGALWGEMLASRCHAKHLVFLIDEAYKRYDDTVMSFLVFKYARRELACIDKNVMKRLLAGSLQLSADECYELAAVCSNSAEDVEVPPCCSELGANGKVICIVGRLEKPYVMRTIKELMEYFKTKNDSFDLLLIGGGSSGMVRRIRKVTAGVRNVTVVITGYLYPIPRRLLGRIDVCIANSGSAHMAYSEDVPTVVVDQASNKAIGVLGYDTVSMLVPTGDTMHSIRYYIEEILYGNFLSKHEYTPCEKISESEIHRQYDKHFDFLDQSASSKEYFDLTKAGRGKSEKAMCLIYRIGGCRLLRLAQKVYDMIR